ncbi:hypothetical protein BDV06DRAFT_200314 [Aspergillus oleicola]
MLFYRSRSKFLAEIFPRCTSRRPPIPPPGVARVTPVNASLAQGKGVENSRLVHTSSQSQMSYKAETEKSLLDLAVSISQRPLDGNSAMQNTNYRLPDHNTPSVLQTGQMSKRAIADRYGLSTRDLRVFDQPSPRSAHILVRESAILIHLFDLRVMVQHDHAQIFYVPPVPGSETESTQDTDNNCASRVFSHNMEESLRGDHRQQVGSGIENYELYVLEVALSSVTSVLEAEYNLTEEKVSKALLATDSSTLGGDESIMHSNLRKTLELKRQLASIEQRALQLRTVAQEVLNEDEDMANMYLTDKAAGKPHEVLDHQSVEYLLETYFKASDTIAQQAASLMSRIRRTEETIQYTLSVRRNQIMVLEARLEILMLALAGATLVAGWYGMNLVNYSEESPHAFAVVILLSCAAALASSGYGMHRLRRIRTAQLRT